MTFLVFILETINKKQQKNNWKCNSQFLHFSTFIRGIFTLSRFSVMLTGKKTIQNSCLLFCAQAPFSKGVYPRRKNCSQMQIPIDKVSINVPSIAILEVYPLHFFIPYVSNKHAVLQKSKKDSCFH